MNFLENVNEKITVEKAIKRITEKYILNIWRDFQFYLLLYRGIIADLYGIAE
jgi:hypothetical protein